MLRNSAPLSVDVIITQHLLLCWNTDEQQERGNGGTIKRGGGDVHSGGLCFCVRACKCIKDEDNAFIYPPAPCVTRHLSHSRRSWSANQARSKRQGHVSVKLQIYFICIIQYTIRTRYCSCMYPIHDRDNTKTRKKTHIYIKIRTESQKHHKSLKMFPERDLKWFSGSYFK